MRFDPKVDGEMLKVYPRLWRVFAKVQEKSGYDSEVFDHLLRFVVLFVDPLSEYAEESDFDYRMELCERDLGTPEVVMREVRKWGDVIEEVVFRYFILVSNTQYQTWWGMQMGHLMLMRRLVNGDLEPAQARLLLKDMEQIMDDLVRMESRLFPDERTKRIIAQKAAESKLTGWAEAYAKE